ncbi:hypothetical protein ACWCOT_02235 [Nonomuraea bangladeshensis]
MLETISESSDDYMPPPDSDIDTVQFHREEAVALQQLQKMISKEFKSEFKNLMSAENWQREQSELWKKTLIAVFAEINRVEDAIVALRAALSAPHHMLQYSEMARLRRNAFAALGDLGKRWSQVSGTLIALPAIDEKKSA